jgi:hypothetical protein
MKTVHLGTMSAEDYWRDPGLARLPALPDPAAERIVAAMDELLFPLCQPGDLLLTRHPMDPALADYLARSGFRFEHNRVPLDDGAGDSKASVFGLLQQADPGVVHELLSDVQRVAPYAVLPDTEAFCRRYGLFDDGPALAAVTKVNSKAYSHQLAVALGLKDYGCVVESAAELVERGRRYLVADGTGKSAIGNRAYGDAAARDTRGGLLVKDPFGVSGKGNLLVQSEGMLERIGAHLAAQERAGKKVSLLLEPFLAKELDFSCQMRIDADGTAHCLSLQQMHNQQLSYQGSSRLGDEQAAFLERAGYMRQMEAVAAQVYRDGYWGDLCIDSMVLQGGTVAPVVEINARQSMGLINHSLEQFFDQDQLPSHLGFLSLGYVGSLWYAEFLDEIKRAGLLFNQGQRRGVVPLSANALTINMNSHDQHRPPGKARKGRLYYAILARREERQPWLDRLRSFCRETGFLLYA